MAEETTPSGLLHRIAPMSVSLQYGEAQLPLVPAAQVFAADASDRATN